MESYLTYPSLQTHSRPLSLFFSAVYETYKSQDTLRKDLLFNPKYLSTKDPTNSLPKHAPIHLARTDLFY